MSAVSYLSNPVPNALKKPSKQAFVKAALVYADRGCAVFPLLPNGKAPMTTNGYKDATKDKDQIIRWWEAHPDANIGIATGERSNLLVLDVDTKNGLNGRKQLHELQKQLGLLPSRTRIVNTPSGGRHIYFNLPDELRGIPLKNLLARGVEIKGNGRYIVAPPSLIDGVAYEVAVDEAPAVMRSLWIEACIQPIDWEKYQAKRDGKTVCQQHGITMAHVIDIPSNARKTGSGYLFKNPLHGATGDGNLFVNPSLNLWHCFRCDSGGDPLTWIAVREDFIDCDQAGRLDKDTFKKCVEVASREGFIPQLKAQVVVSSSESGQEKFEVTFGKSLTDVGNAERFVERYGDVVRYCKEMRAWFIWDDHRWVQDKVDKIMRLAVKVPPLIDLEVGLIDRLESKSDVEKQNLKLTYRNWARSSAYKNRLEAMLDLAKTFDGIAIRAQQLDQDPCLLNVRNGTINLQTGEIRPHNKEDYITRCIPVDYKPEAVDEKWEVFLDCCVPNDAVRSFLKRAAGYSFTGLTVQEAIFFLFGPPASGKSTFLEALLNVLGGYGIPSNFSAFLTQRGNAGGPREDVARLNGARMVLCSEVNRNTTWNSALLKSLTSGDSMNARNPYSPYSVNFVPVFKLWLGANYRPKCDYDDDAAFRRFNIVPFDVHIPKEEQDRTLKDYFKNNESAREAILAWAVAGCIEWADSSKDGADGLQAPEEVSAATSQYQQAMNPLYTFIKNECKVGCDTKTGESFEVLGDALWEEFTSLNKRYYTRDMGRLVPSKKSFGHYLHKLGFTRQRKTTGMREYYWTGLRLLEDSEDNSADAAT
ncbi:MAG: phage/plasmid primase, P4 family [Halobacteriota archaeon]